MLFRVTTLKSFSQKARGFQFPYTFPRALKMRTFSKLTENELQNLHEAYVQICTRLKLTDKNGEVPQSFSNLLTGITTEICRRNASKSE